MSSQEKFVSFDLFSNFPPLQKAVKLSTNLICDRPANEIRVYLNELIDSINKQLSLLTSQPKRRASFSARMVTQSLSIKPPSRTPSRTPTTPRTPIMLITPITPITSTIPKIPKTLTHHKSSHAISSNGNYNNNEPYYWKTLYIHTKICLMDLKYWERGEGHPENRTSSSFYSQPKISWIYRDVRLMDQKRLIENILTDLGKIQETVIEKLMKTE